MWEYLYCSILVKRIIIGLFWSTQLKICHTILYFIYNLYHIHDVIIINDVWLNIMLIIQKYKIKCFDISNFIKVKR